MLARRRGPRRSTASGKFGKRSNEPMTVQPAAVAEAEALGLGNLGPLPGAGQSSPWIGGVQRRAMVSDMW